MGADGGVCASSLALGSSTTDQGLSARTSSDENDHGSYQHDVARLPQGRRLESARRAGRGGSEPVPEDGGRNDVGLLLSAEEVRVAARDAAENEVCREHYEDHKGHEDGCRGYDAWRADQGRGLQRVRRPE